MEMTAVKSSAVKSLGWEELRMTVVYASGGTYVFENVPLVIFEIIRTSTSVGSSLHSLVTKFPLKYPSRKIS